MNKDTPQSNGFSKSSPMTDSYSSGYTPQSNTDWREKLIVFYNATPAYKTVSEFESFISQLLEAEKKRWRKEVEGMKKDGSQETRDRIEKDGYGYLFERLVGYNIAIDDVLQKLS